ncbi:Gfo/Idh/MocA family oxidoreductase [Nostoc sp. 'Lobaria pulmonaria (5183) cyanobiont']|uniref:Gfo/Idh/MocA family oxidoreductase n=1 Tax=Nostoc sp. 'Lobaria pulmonaria (5183) cyanobiont' TaxID=1618022 RepID=UPI0018F88188|nr:Gfo/Idh/MocA family oxidoreductase [Nostoc sp. 'Lobaria pulmonaria (5183) cyanobiont']
METINTALCSSGLSGMVFHAPFIDLHPGFKLVGSGERSKKLIQQHSSQGSYLGYYDAVYKSIVNNQPTAVTAEDGINVMRIIEAAIKSSNEQKVIALL